MYEERQGNYTVGTSRRGVENSIKSRKNIQKTKVRSRTRWKISNPHKIMEVFNDDVESTEEIKSSTHARTIQHVPFNIKEGDLTFVGCDDWK